MQQHLTIVTGASRGLGLALATQLLAQGHRVLTLARHRNAELEAAAPGAAQLVQWQVDLADAAPVCPRLHDWLAACAAADFKSVTLINNAGVLPPLVPLRDSKPADLANALRVGLEAAMLLTATFLQATQAWPGQRRVLNISSGLGRRPAESLAGYCAAKAGMDLFTHCVALEEARQPNGARMCSLAPGVVATDMQVQLRAADPSGFPDLERYRQLQERGVLVSPAQTAERILAHLQGAAFGTDIITDIRSIAGV